jgi:2-dehydropantoate 2-reductase
MRYLVYGAGTIGGLLGGMLSKAGHDVTLVTRGAHREAMAARGLRIHEKSSGRTDTIEVNAVLPGEEKPPYDVVYVTLKAHQIAGSAEHIAALRAKDGCYVFVQNGLPWWYFDGIASPHAGTRLKTLDPDGRLARRFPVETIVGSLIFKPCDMTEPGSLSHTEAPSDRLVIGEVDNTLTPRLEKIAADMSASGFKCEISPDIRKSKWTKLLNNAVWNPLCALTQSGNHQIAAHAPTRELAAAMIAEAKAVAAAVGIALDVDPARTAADMAQRAPATSSTLADVRCGRQLELDALCRSMIEMADLVGVPVPYLKAITACAGLLDQRIVQDGVAFRPFPVR